MLIEFQNALLITKVDYFNLLSTILKSFNSFKETIDELLILDQKFSELLNYFIIVITLEFFKVNMLDMSSNIISDLHVKFKNV